MYVASFPPGALIKINGTSYGNTDKFVYDVPAGAHQTLTLTLTGYKQYDGFVDVPVNGTKILPPITLTPQPTTGTLYVKSTPWDASIWIDSSYYGQTPKMVTGVPAGNNRNLTLIKSGYLQKTVLVNVTAGQVTLLPRITLTPIP